MPPPPAPRQQAPSPKGASQQGPGQLAIFSIVGFVLLCAGFAYLYSRQDVLFEAQAQVDPAKVSLLDGRVAALESALRTQAQQLTQLQQRPAAAPATSSAPATAAPSPAELAPINDRIAALEKRLQALATQPAAPAPSPVDITATVAPLAAQLKSVAGQAESTQTTLSERIATLEKRVTATEQSAAQGAEQATKAVDQASRAATDAGKAAQDAAKAAQQAGQADAIQRALAALDSGQVLGQIPGAPPALSRFAQNKPPTEAELRLTFPAAAERAAEASRPPTANLNVFERMWLRMRAMVTVRQGDKVIVGAPAITTLNVARGRLDAGDLAGAVAALDNLDGPAAAAIAGWKSQAQSLLDARAALTTMAHS
jgi:hypothetical protein